MIKIIIKVIESDDILYKLLHEFMSTQLYNWCHFIIVITTIHTQVHSVENK